MHVRTVQGAACALVYVKAGVSDYVKTVNRVHKELPAFRHHFVGESIGETDAEFRPQGEQVKIAATVLCDPPYNVTDLQWDKMDVATAAQFMQMATALLVPGGVVWVFQQFRVRACSPISILDHS